METPYSKKLFKEASKHLVGGVNSPVRAFRGVGGTPLFILRAKGSRLWDADGNEYIDYVGSWGPAILGHAPAEVLKALHDAANEGLSFGAPTIREIKLAEAVKEAFPSMELVRFVNSGTEAAMSAIRLARGFTGRSKIIKFDGAYHGHADYLLVKAGSGAQTLGTPDSAGVPPEMAGLTLTAEFNNIGSVKEIFRGNKKEIACVIVEPVMGNIGCIPPKENFLKELRDLCQDEGALLVFDEVMTGFRVAFGGAQALYPITPDLTCLGKIVGGGLPVGAYGGRPEIMEKVAPLGPVYQAGTLSGNPLAMAAGLATLRQLAGKNTEHMKKVVGGAPEGGPPPRAEVLSTVGDAGATGPATFGRDIYEALEEKGSFLEMGLRATAKRLGIPLQVNRVGSMFSFFFSRNPVTNARQARESKGELFKKLFHQLLAEGVYLPPSPFEACFISLAHSEKDLDDTLEAFEKSLAQVITGI